MKNTCKAIENAHVVLESGIIFDGTAVIENGNICTVGLYGEIGAIACGKGRHLVFADDLFHVKHVMLGGTFCDI